MADAMNRVRAAEARHNEVIERTAQLDKRPRTLETNLQGLAREAERTVGVLSNLQRELDREEQVVKFRSERLEQANSDAIADPQVVLPGPVHGLVFWAL